MISSLFGMMLLANQQQEPGIGKITIGNKEIPIILPESRSKYNLERWITQDGKTYEITEDGAPGVVFAETDGWNVVRRDFAKYESVNATPTKIKIIVATDAFLGDKGYNPYILNRRGYINSSLTSELYTALGQAYAAITTFSEGKIKPEFHFEIDAATIIEELDSNTEPTPSNLGTIGLSEPTISNHILGERLVYERVISRVNTQEFKSDDPTFRGPYDMVVLLHAGLTNQESVARVGEMPVWVVPLITATSDRVDKNFASKLFYHWLSTLEGNGIPYQPWTNRWKHFTPEPNVVQARQGRPTDSISIAPERVENFYQPFSGDLLAQPIGLGDYALSAENGRYKITKIGTNDQGFVLLAGGFGSQAPAITIPKSLRMGFSGEIKDRWAVNFHSSSGEIIGSVQFNGSALPVKLSESNSEPVTVLDARVQTETGGVRQFVASLAPLQDKKITAITIGTPANGRYFSREFGGKEEITISHLAFGEDQVDPMPIRWANPLESLGAIGETLTIEQETTALALLGGQDRLAKHTVLRRLLKVKAPGLIPALGEIVAGVDDMATYLATQCLAYQDTAESRAILFNTMQKGPFDMNRAFALRAYQGDVLNSDVRSLSMLVFNRNWVIRRDAAKKLAGLQDEMAIATLITTFPDPEPGVRATVASLLDAKHELASRRLAFSSVNDPNEFVRLACLKALISSDNERFSQDALRVRDESPAVRIELLRWMSSIKNEGVRTALQSAMIDKNPLVIVAALQSFKKLEGDVEFREVQTAIQFDDEAVIIALLDLAVTKKLNIPQDYLNKQANSTNQKISELAKQLGGTN